MVKKGESGYPENRQRVRIYPSAHGTVYVINYAGDNKALNEFLSTFDIWGNSGHFKWNENENAYEVWFEMAMGFFEFSKCEAMKRAFKQFGVRVEFG